MTDWGAHHFDIAQWVLGMDHSGPVEILPPDGQDRKRLTFRYADGTLVHHSGYNVEEGVTFVGTDGQAKLFGVAGRAEFGSTELNRQLTEKAVTGNDLFGNRGHYADFLDCVRRRRRPVGDIETGCRSVTVCHLGNIAYALQRPLKWNPDQEEFLDDAEATRLLARARANPGRHEARMVTAWEGRSTVSACKGATTDNVPGTGTCAMIRFRELRVLIDVCDMPQISLRDSTSHVAAGAGTPSRCYTQQSRPHPPRGGW